MAKPIRLRQQAATDLEAAAEYIRVEAGESSALEFVDAVERALARVGRSPRVGSLRFAYELDIPGLRAWSIRRFGYVVFYVEGSEVVEVWRVLHGRRDIPTTLAELDR